MEAPQTIEPPPSPMHPPPRKYRLADPLAGVLLIFLIALLLFRSVASLRTEQHLHSASLPELLAISNREKDNPRVFYYLGLRAQEAGQGQQAMSAFWRAASLAPDDEKLWFLWSQTAFNVQGSSAARDILLTFLKVHPQNVLMHRQLAQLLEQSNDAREAFTVARRATQIAPNDANAWQLLGKIALEQHDANQAETAFQHAIALDPNDSINHASLGDAYFVRTRYSEAASAYREAARLAPHLGTTYMALGQALLKTAISSAEIESARADLLKALARPATMQRTGLYYTYLCLGQSYARQSRWQEALPWLKQAVALQVTAPDINSDVHFELARVYRALKDPAGTAREVALHQDIVDYFLQSKALASQLSAHPDDTQTGLRLARLFAAHHNINEAVKTYRSVLAHAATPQAIRQEMTATVGREMDTR